MKVDLSFEIGDEAVAGILQAVVQIETINEERRVQRLRDSVQAWETSAGILHGGRLRQAASLGTRKQFNDIFRRWILSIIDGVNAEALSAEDMAKMTGLLRSFEPLIDLAVKVGPPEDPTAA